MSTPFLADQTNLQIDDGASSAYTDVTGVLTITPPDPKLGNYDATMLRSTTGVILKAPLSRKDLGDFSWTMFNDATESLRLYLLIGAAHNFKITYPNARVDTIPGFISAVSTAEMQDQEPSKLTVTVTVTGAITRA